MGERVAALQRHPRSAGSAGIEAVTIEVARADACLRLDYRVSGDVAALAIPPACACRPRPPVDGLWQHTCFELFVARTDAREYREFNFSPSGDWAAYAFSDYRSRDPEARLIGTSGSALDYRADALKLTVLLPLSLLPRGSLDIGAAAVLKESGGEKSYWALAHCGQAPDFHLRASFVLPLSLPAPLPESAQ